MHNSTGAGNGRVVAVVVTHQRLAQLRVTLPALLASDPQALAAVLVVDNASDDGTPEWLAAQSDPRLSVLRLDENRGGAGGFDAGMRRAMRDLSPDWIVVMDDDARPEPGAMAAFQALDLSGYDGFAAAVRHPNGALCEMNRPTYNPFWHKGILLRTLLGGGRGAFHLGPEDFATPGLRAIDGASFVGFFVRAAAVQRRGYPDPALFLYGDDAIYTMGLTKAGHRLGFDPSVRFEHDSSTYSAADPRIKPLWKVYYYHRNLLILYRIATGLFFVPVLCLYLPRWLLRLRHHRGERGRFLRLFGLALIDGLRRRTDRARAEVLRIAEGRR
ncbi:glycosyltransferase [Pararhodobacter zhoushanensis]|uniref:Glycosyltransferase n=1 Tax=Pararhodobacter zhoushanensis TaxID=2479545 RepID=A0ABT3GVI8_9RHOB|nr:glycosyltransferase [Pararhodobacter zhoushanensis]MCW1931509.1 glycosyltransferase [Pararhodobacter zhoushanensis]